VVAWRWQRETVEMGIWHRMSHLPLAVPPADGRPSKFGHHCEHTGIKKRYSAKNVRSSSPSRAQLISSTNILGKGPLFLCPTEGLCQG